MRLNHFCLDISSIEFDQVVDFLCTLRALFENHSEAVVATIDLFESNFSTTKKIIIKNQYSYHFKINEEIKNIRLF